MTNITSIKHQGHRTLQGPRQDALLELSDLLAVLEHNGVLADQVDPRDMAVEIDADQRPVQARGDLLDMGRFTCTVEALHHDPAIKGEAGADGLGRLRIETIGCVNIRHMRITVREGRHLHVDINTEHVTDIDLFIGHMGQQRIGIFKLGRHGGFRLSAARMYGFQLRL